MKAIIAVAAVTLFFIGAFLEFFEVRSRSPKIRLRKDDISALIAGTAFGLLGLIALLTALFILD